MEGVDWPRAIAMDEMAASLKKSGWTGTDLKQYINQSKHENFAALDEFAGGALSEIRGTPLYPVLLEATALRHAMHMTNITSGLKLVPVECPHGFRMVACNKCLKGSS